jgi:hypothetical protein
MIRILIRAKMSRIHNPSYRYSKDSRYCEILLDSKLQSSKTDEIKSKRSFSSAQLTEREMAVFRSQNLSYSIQFNRVSLCSRLLPVCRYVKTKSYATVHLIKKLKGQQLPYLIMWTVWKGESTQAK